MEFEARPPRKHLVGVWLTAAERDAVRRAVDRSGGGTVSDFLRKIIGLAVSMR